MSFAPKFPPFIDPGSLKRFASFLAWDMQWNKKKLLSKVFFQFLLFMKISPYLVYTLSIQTLGGFNPVPYMSHIVGVLNFS